MAAYEIGLAILGVGVLGTVVLPRLLTEYPLSFPMFYVGFGAVVFSLPLGFPPPDPLVHTELTRRLTELVVIVALMGAGLSIDRAFGVSRWATTWRLLAVTMPLTIVAIALLGWAVVGLAPAAALLAGAVLAPTDPVIAGDVQVGPPTEAAAEDVPPEDIEDDVRFALTSEAGFNDGLAFPFTYLAIAVATAGLAPAGWLGEWLLVDVGYKIATGTLGGVLFGWLTSRLVFATPATTELAKTMEGVEAFAATLVAYGVTELAGGYGFLAVFITALTMREYERSHDYQKELHEFMAVGERLLTAAVLMLFGGALVTGLLDSLTVAAAVVAVVAVLVVRPLAGLLGLLGTDHRIDERAAISWFGIRGVGSFFYVSYAFTRVEFPHAGRLWAFVGCVVLVSVIVHGVSTSPVMNALDRWR